MQKAEKNGDGIDVKFIYLKIFVKKTIVTYNKSIYLQHGRVADGMRENMPDSRS